MNETARVHYEDMVFATATASSPLAVLHHLASFWAVRDRANVVSDNRQFFNRGTSGQWRDLFEDGDQARYDARRRELAADPEFAAWAHGGAAPPRGAS